MRISTMRISTVRKAAIGLAAVAGSMGLSMAAPVAAHAEQTATAVQSVADTTSSSGGSYGGGSVDSSPLYVKKALIGVIAADQGDGCTQYTYFYSDGSKAVVYRCLIIVRA
jgi:hypothetical protein